MSNLFTVLKKGNCVDNPEFWKNIQSLVNLVGGLSAFIVILFPQAREYLTVENLGAVGGAISALNVYFTTSTSEKVGI